MKKIIILAIVLIVIVVLVFLIISGLKQKSATTNNLIRFVYLEKIPAGTEFKPGMQGTFATTFKKDDQMALSGKASFVGKATLTAKIVKEGATTTQDAMPSVLLKSGDFGFCCISVPAELGKYYLHIYTEGKEETLSPLSFEVIE